MSRSGSTEKLIAVILGLLAVLSPLYIDRKPLIEEDEDDAASGIFAMGLPLLLIFLIAAINFTCFMDRGFTRFDPYWIHRVGGSSCGIVICLLVLGFFVLSKLEILQQIDYFFFKIIKKLHEEINIANIFSK
ncbi:hypothetical protein LUZ60_005625 [Juncus effusus]|nr:hypothetical protein LUZ60_005625 [Juncus effusus]